MGEAQKKRKNKKPKHFFLVSGQNEEYVIRNEDIVYFYICNSQT